MEKVAIIGFGKLGRALTKILESKPENCEVRVWDVIQTGDHHQVSFIKEVTESSSVIFLVVPSKNFRECGDLLGSLDPNKILVSCTKGLADSSGTLPFSVLEKTYPQNTVGVISGPMLSEELDQMLPTRASLASNNKEKIRMVAQLFDGTPLRLEISDDLTGVSLLGVLKNVYALSLGLCEGLDLGSNFKSCLALQAFREMGSILTELGGKMETLTSPAGLSDFLTTGYSSKSRNFTYGYKKARGEYLSGIMAEGAANIDNVTNLLKNLERYPLLETIQLIFIESKNPRETLLRVMSL